MKTLGLASFTACLVIALHAHAGDDAQKKDNALLQGKWKVASFETNKGKDANFEGAVLEFGKDGKSLTFTHLDKTKKGTYTLNPAGKPKEIDLKPADEPNTLEGVYHIEKDSLKICLAPEPGDGRPGELALKDGKNYVLITLDRVK